MWPSSVKGSPVGTLEPTEACERVFRSGRVESRLAQGWAFHPHPLPPKLNRLEFLDRLSDEHEAALIAISTLQGAAQSCPFKNLLVAPLLSRDAVTSSRIENTIATPREVAMVAAGQTPAREEATEVNNYRKAVMHGLTSPLPVCMRLVKEMHHILMTGVRGGDQTPGEIRTVQNWIGSDESDFSSARFVPPRPGEPLLECLKNLEQFWNADPRLYEDGTKRLKPLIEIAIAHYQFECIHPFSDGNGRLGRAIAALSLVRSGLIDTPLVYISGFFDERRDRYYDLLLQLSMIGDWVAWCSFFLQGVAAQARDAQARVGRITDERERVRRSLQNQGAAARVFGLLDHLIQHQYTDVKMAAEFMGVEKPTARADIEKLEIAGFLAELSGQSYARYWGAVPIFEIIDPTPPSQPAVAPTLPHPPDAPPTAP
ncbi:MAG: Fic family protein [Phycisphaerales bacterium]